MEYPPRPKPIGICKCGHKYNEHSFGEDKWYVFWEVNLNRVQCEECMCPQYQEVKIIDEKTGNEIHDDEVKQ